MLIALAFIVFAVGVVLNIGAVFALSSWQATRAGARRAHEQWMANGAEPDKEPASAPGVTAPAAVLGLGLVLLSASTLFLFAFHLGAS